MKPLVHPKTNEAIIARRWLMPSKRFHLFVLAVLLAVSMSAESSNNGSTPPNFTLMLADDLGYPSVSLDRNQAR